MSFIQEIKNELNTREIKPDLQPYRQGGMTFTHEPNIPLTLQSPAQVREFCAGVFLAAARSGIKLGASEKAHPDSSSKRNSPDNSRGSGYHIEFVFESLKNAQEFCEIIAGFEILPKLTERRGSIVIYIKSSECICNLLALIGAGKCLMSLSNEIAMRELRNNANRRTNCDTHNITKQIETSNKQIEIIRELLANGKPLDAKLREVAEARLNYPEASYEELAKILNLTKSGIMHRIRRITDSTE